MDVHIMKQIQWHAIMAECQTGFQPVSIIHKLNTKNDMVNCRKKWKAVDNVIDNNLCELHIEGLVVNRNVGNRWAETTKPACRNTINQEPHV